MKMIYLDYAATTPAHPLVLRAFKHSLLTYPGNPNSGHELGQLSAKAIEQSLKNMRRALKLSKHYELTPTSGASEANNLAIKGIAFLNANQGKHIITTSFEHSSTIATANYLSQQGYQVEIAPTDHYGRVDVNLLEKLITPDTILISICSVNSEIGIRQPIAEIKDMLKRHPKVYFHVDATQSIGKEQLDLEGIDLISLTAHKFFGLKGIGLLIAHERVKLIPLIHGGHSTTPVRRGTPATELILSMERALKLALKQQETGYQHCRTLNDYARQQLKSLEGIIINSTLEDLPHILNFSIIGKNSRDTVTYLSNRGIYISNHTACESDTDYSSGIYALTHDRARAESSVRISLAYLTTSNEIDELCRALKEYI